MSRPPSIPASLIGTVFTSAQARAAGVSPSMLRGKHFHSLHRGVWCLQTTELTFELRVRAAALALPADAILSHVSALQWHGVDVGRTAPVHFSTNKASQVKHDIVLHRRGHRLSSSQIRGIEVLGPDRSFVDSATILSLRDLVRAGDALVRLGSTTVETLLEYVVSSHLDGVVRARQAAMLIRERVDSFRETDVRLLLVTAGLPEPAVNVDVHAPDGSWLARGDLVIEDLRIVVEHDGWHHERDASQRQKDHLRRERIEAAGWILIVVTAADFLHPTSIVARVYEAMARRGYRGHPPDLGREWHQIARNL
ncbi:hypothetical protein GCM10022234_24970 [Aeromicrobium panaciterrae]|uniref:hypothetical protein n=1 Tax=Aeromicrobium panaciterrae TaxID=363861 RepID=UPI0031DC2FA2